MTKIARVFGILMAAGLAASATVVQAQIPPPSKIPSRLSADDERSLSQRRDDLLKAWSKLDGDIDAQNATCGDVTSDQEARVQECSRTQAEIQKEKSDYGDALRSFVTSLKAAEERAAAGNWDPRVVDARVDKWGSDLVAALNISEPEIAERTRKGLQAAAHGDWPAALAWWQDALNHDPGNPILRRSVDLAKWTMDARRQHGVPVSTPFDAAFAVWSKGNKTEAMRLMQETLAKNPDFSKIAKPTIDSLTQQAAASHTVDSIDIDDSRPRTIAEQAALDRAFATLHRAAESYTGDKIVIDESHPRTMAEQAALNRAFATLHMEAAAALIEKGSGNKDQTYLKWANDHFRLAKAYRTKAIDLDEAIARGNEASPHDPQQQR